MADHREGRAAPRSSKWTIGALLVVAALVLAACNPLIGLRTEPNGWVGESSWSWPVFYEGREGGWVEVQVRDGQDEDLSVFAKVAANGQPWPRECFADAAGGGEQSRQCGDESVSPCPFDTPQRLAWQDDTSIGYRRLAWIEPDEMFMITVTGSDDAVTFDVRVTDDTGQRIGNLQYLENVVGMPICG